MVTVNRKRMLHVKSSTFTGNPLVTVTCSLCPLWTLMLKCLLCLVCSRFVVLLSIGPLWFRFPRCFLFTTPPCYLVKLVPLCLNSACFPLMVCQSMFVFMRFLCSLAYSILNVLPSLYWTLPAFRSSPLPAHLSCYNYKQVDVILLFINTSYNCFYNNDFKGT